MLCSQPLTGGGGAKCLLFAYKVLLVMHMTWQIFLTKQSCARLTVSQFYCCKALIVHEKNCSGYLMFAT